MKKSLSVLLAIVMLMAMSIPAFAMSEKEGGVISTRYDAITTLRVYIDMSGSTATCVANVSHRGAEASIELILQESTNGGSSFSDYSTLADETFSSRSFSVEESEYGLNSNYEYRTKVVIRVYDSSGRQIDSETAYS